MSTLQVRRSVYREDHEQLRASARRFFEKECVPHQERWNEQGMVDREVWEKAGREGLMRIALPTEYGGGGGDFGHSAVIAEEYARAGINGFALTLQSEVVAPYINRIGTEEQKRRWLDNNIRVVEVAWVALRSGLCLTAVNRYLTPDEAVYILDDCDARVVVAS